jgi:hypothetical protein
MRESMSEKNNDYLKAIEYLNAKKSVVKSKSTVVDAETFITCENNIGYYYFKLNDLNNAKIYFENAFKTSTDPKINNLDGAFVSLMNLVNLYALRFESNDKSPDIKNELSSLLKRAEKFRNDYEKIAYDSAYDALKSEAKATKRTISDEEIADLKQKIKDESDNIYYRIDGAIGILIFYYAELLRKEILNLSEDPKILVKKHSELSEQYYRAYKILTDSQAAIARLGIENEINSEFPIRMKVNSAVCMYRLGKYDEADLLFDQAKKQADEFKFVDLSKKISALRSQLPKPI